MWRIQYSQEVRNYIYDSYPYTETIWQTIKTLRHTPDGRPPANYSEVEPDRIQWTVAGHWVIYQRHPDKNTLEFLALKPLDEDE